MAKRDLVQGLVCASPSERGLASRNPRYAASVARFPAVVWGADRRGARRNVESVQTRRQLQEDMAQLWCPQAPAGSTSCRELFCTPILFSFGDPITESQLDLMLAYSKRHLAIEKRLQKQFRKAGLMPLVVLDDFFPMSGIRRASLQQASNAVHARSPDELRRVASSWTRAPQLPMRQSSEFLVYLIGIHAGPHNDSSFCEGKACKSIAEEIDRFVGENTGMTVSTQVTLFRRFFDGLYGGIWMYQDARLAQIASRILRRAAAETVKARITVELSREAHTIRLSLCAGDSDSSDSHQFRLIGRPGDDHGVSLARIRAVLQRAGINTVDVTGLEPREMHIAALSSDPRAASRLAVPV